MNISLFLNINIIEIIDILQSGKDIKMEQLFKYAIIQNTQENLLKKYNQYKELLKDKNNHKIVLNNGTVTQIINHKKLLKSNICWMGVKEQDQNRNLE